MSIVEDRNHRRRGRKARLSPDVVRHTSFEKTPLGRRGYPEADVDKFLRRVADELAVADSEKADLRAEVDRLRNYFRGRNVNPDASAPDAQAPSVQAVNTLSLAQQAADQHIAQAESHARSLLGDARRQYEAIVEEAQERAHEAAEAASQAYEAASQAKGQTADQAALEAKVAYLRTFAEVTQVQMRSILEALRQELDRLSHLEVNRPA